MRPVTSPPSQVIVALTVMSSNLEDGVTVSFMERVVHETPAAVAEMVADRIMEMIAASDGRFTLGLAGGSSPKTTYEQLRKRDAPWERVDAWLSDERWVDYNDERSNGKMAADALFDHVAANFVRPPWHEMIRPEDSAAHYEAMVRSIHPRGTPDLILLGMGEDGHTASLFPDTKALSEQSRWIVANFVPEQEEVRLTATYPLLWRARQIFFLVTGVSKASAVREAFEGITPAGRVGEGNARVTWHLDTAAASQVS